MVIKLTRTIIYMKDLLMCYPLLNSWDGKWQGTLKSETLDPPSGDIHVKGTEAGSLQHSYSFLLHITFDFMNPECVQKWQKSSHDLSDLWTLLAFKCLISSFFWARGLLRFIQTNDFCSTNLVGSGSFSPKTMLICNPGIKSSQMLQKHLHWVVIIVDRWECIMLWV